MRLTYGVHLQMYLQYDSSTNINKNINEDIVSSYTCMYTINALAIGVYEYNSIEKLCIILYCRH